MNINTKKTTEESVADTTANADAVQTSKSAVGFVSAVKKKLNVIIPSVVVCICAVFVIILLRNEIESVNGMLGKFICSTAQGTELYIDFEDNGTYRYLADENAEIQNGRWEYNSDKVILKADGSQESRSLYFIDNKYLAFDDEKFLEGAVPEGSLFDAEFTADDGTVYVFDSDGKCYSRDEGRNIELGGYMTDGKFIVITIENTAHTYLNCGDGITPVFYTRS